MISKIYRFIIKIVFQELFVTDPDVGFKGFQKNVFTKIIKHTNLDGWSWDLQFLVMGHKLGFKTAEFPFNWNEKVYTGSTVNIISDSIKELIGLLYIKIKSILHKDNL